MEIMNGCSSTRPFVRSVTHSDNVQKILQSVLARSDYWISMSSSIKLTLKINRESVKMKGHIMFLAGERYEVGFVPPFNRMLGNFYVTPDQTIYWDRHAAPHRILLNDTLKISDMLPLPLPNWEPRDLLPFPLSGRNGGLQIDSIKSSDNDHCVAFGHDGTSTRELKFDLRTGAIDQEIIHRNKRVALYKKFGRLRTIHGWVIPTQVQCSDSADDNDFKWTLKSPVIRTESQESPNPSKD
jgi:hypothetical protein